MEEEGSFDFAKALQQIKNRRREVDKESHEKSLKEIISLFQKSNGRDIEWSGDMTIELLQTLQRHDLHVEPTTLINIQTRKMTFSIKM